MSGPMPLPCTTPLIRSAMSERCVPTFDPLWWPLTGEWAPREALVVKLLWPLVYPLALTHLIRYASCLCDSRAHLLRVLHVLSRLSVRLAGNYFRQSRLGGGIMLSIPSVRTFVRPSVRYQSSEHDIVKTNELISLEIDTSGLRCKWNGQLWGSGRQSSRSNEAELRCIILDHFRWVHFLVSH